MMQNNNSQLIDSIIEMKRKVDSVKDQFLQDIDVQRIDEIHPFGGNSKFTYILDSSSYKAIIEITPEEFVKKYTACETLERFKSDGSTYDIEKVKNYYAQLQDVESGASNTLKKNKEAFINAMQKSSEKQLFTDLSDHSSNNTNHVIYLGSIPNDKAAGTYNTDNSITIFYDIGSANPIYKHSVIIHEFMHKFYYNNGELITEEKKMVDELLQKFPPSLHSSILSKVAEDFDTFSRGGLKGYYIESMEKSDDIEEKKNNFIKFIMNEASTRLYDVIKRGNPNSSLYKSCCRESIDLFSKLVEKESEILTLHNIEQDLFNFSSIFNEQDFFNTGSFLKYAQKSLIKELREKSSELMYDYVIKKEIEDCKLQFGKLQTCEASLELFRKTLLLFEETKKDTFNEIAAEVYETLDKAFEKPKDYKESLNLLEEIANFINKNEHSKAKLLPLLNKIANQAHSIASSTTIKGSQEKHFSFLSNKLSTYKKLSEKVDKYPEEIRKNWSNLKSFSSEWLSMLMELSKLKELSILEELDAKSLDHMELSKLKELRTSYPLDTDITSLSIDAMMNFMTPKEFVSKIPQHQELQEKLTRQKQQQQEVQQVEKPQQQQTEQQIQQMQQNQRVQGILQSIEKEPILPSQSHIINSTKKEHSK